MSIFLSAQGGGVGLGLERDDGAAHDERYVGINDLAQLGDSAVRDLGHINAVVAFSNANTKDEEDVHGHDSAVDEQLRRCETFCAGVPAESSRLVSPFEG
jgi:hypothetical protein